MNELIPLKLYGSNADIEPSQLPNDIFTNAFNMRFADGAIEKITGYKTLYVSLLTVPWKLHNYVTATNSYWMFAGSNAIVVHDGTTQHNITPIAGRTTTVDNRWNKATLNGMPIFNNRTDVPISWDGVLSNPMTDIPGWPAGYKCNVIRAFKNFVFALNMEESGIRLPHKYRWSDAAAPGTLPTEWTATDTNDAGSGNLSETQDFIVDGLPLKDVFIIYKQNSTYAIQYIGGRYIFKDELLFGSFGALAEGCVVEFDGQHAVLTTNDFIVHNGNSHKSVMDDIWRKFLFSQINSEFIDTCYLFHKQNDSEIWICYPQGASEFPNYAIVWNYRENVFYNRKIVEGYDKETGIVVPAGIDDSWGADNNSWESDETIWDEKLYIATNDTVVSATLSLSVVLEDEGELFGNDPYNHYVERLTMPIINNKIMKQFNSLWPNIDAPNGTTINIHVGVQDTPSDNVEWIVNEPFTVGVDEHIDFFIEGRYLSVKFEATIESRWKLYDFLIGVLPKGIY